MRRRSRVPLALTGIVAGLLAIAAVLAAARHNSGPPEPSGHLGRTLSAGDPSIAPATPDRSAFESQPSSRKHPRKDVQEPRPVRIRIPAISVNARVVKLGLGPDRTMQTPANYSDTGWFEPGPEPGERGAAVIAGHVDSVNGPAVFYRLGELHRGNRIRITVASGRTIGFSVRGLERWPKNKFPTKRVFGTTRNATLRLITCGGPFDQSTGHYLDNTIVYAVRLTAGRN
jgi:sortase (surface protein transpeptidase)